MKISRFLVISWLAISVISTEAQAAPGFFVPRISIHDPHPLIDGHNQTGEYGAGYRRRHLSYEPVLPTSEAAPVINLLAVEENELEHKPAELFVCISGLPRGRGTASEVGLYFDTAYNRGPHPDADDVRIVVSEGGTMMVLHGNGVDGFVPILDVPSVIASVNADALTWTLEVGIPLSLLGGGTPWSTIGCFIEHRNVTTGGLAVGTPFNGEPSRPDTWGTLTWFPTGRVPRPTLLDVARITQGLEEDLSAGTRHDFVAGKETAVMAQVWTDGAAPRVLNAECIVARTSPDPEVVDRIPVHWRWPGGAMAPPEIRRMPVGRFDSSPFAFARVPGNSLARAGEYSFTLALTVEGRAFPEHIPLGVRQAVETPDLRLLLLPWNDVVVCCGLTPLDWDSRFEAALPQTLAEVSRIYPLRTGVSELNGSGGLRFLLVPPAGGCRPGESPDDCDQRKRRIANSILNDYNAHIAMLERTTGESGRDRLDFHVVLSTVDRGGGGQAQLGFDPGSSAIFFGPNVADGSGFTLVQEVAHCLDQVKADSPNADTPFTAHSRSWPTIPMADGIRGVNLVQETFVASPSSAMSFLAPTLVSFMEGYEWNSFSTELRVHQTNPRFRAASAARRAKAAGTDDSLLEIVGLLDRNGAFTLDYSRRVNAEDYYATPRSDQGNVEVRFFDGNQNVLGNYPFLVSDEAEHHMNEPDPRFQGLIAMVPLPSSTARWTLLFNGNVVHQSIFSAAAPQIRSVTATRTSPDEVLVAWDATDPDSPVLAANILVLTPPNNVPMLIEHAVRTNMYLLNTRHMPASQTARVLVEVTDGYQTAEAASNPFSITARPPTVAISGPLGTKAVVAGQPFKLRGWGYDWSDGVLKGSAFNWTKVTGEALGTSDVIELTLPAGLHQVRLIATNSAGLSNKAQIDLIVAQDSDGDGMPDAYEAQHPVLSAQTADADSDADDDGLSNMEEYLLGTDPASPDTDGDGITDADEVAAGSNPLDPQSRPLPRQLVASPSRLVLSGCPTPTSSIGLRTVQTNSQWRAVSDVSWLTFPAQGTNSAMLPVSGDCSGLPPGRHIGTLTFAVTGSAPESVQIVMDVPAANCLDISLGPLPECLRSPSVPISGSVASCTNVTKLVWERGDNLQHVLCENCGVNPSFAFDLPVNDPCQDQTFTVTAYDAANRSGSTSRTISADRTPPTIDCPTNIVVDCTATNGAFVDYAVRVTDNCGSPNLDCTPPSGSFFPIGSTSVRCRATDACGNSNFCTFTVTIRSNCPPASCSANLLVNGSFEAPGSPDGWIDVPGGSSLVPGWTALFNGIEYYNPTVNRWSAMDGHAARGQFVVDLTPFERNGGGVAQTFPTVPGQRYRVSFFMSTLERSGRLGTGSLTASAPGVAHSYFVENHTPYHVWELKIFEFTAALGTSSSTLSFITLDDSALHFVMIDDVRVSDCCDLIDCPPDIHVSCQTNGGATVEYAILNRTICSNAVLQLSHSCVPPSGSFFPIGASSVTCIDSNRITGATSQCHFTVTVSGDCPPDTCSSNLIVNGSFESPGPPDGYAYVEGGSTFITGWKTVLNGVEYADPRGTRTEVMQAGVAADGHYAIDLAPLTFIGGGLEQAIPTSPDRPYYLSFKMATAQFAGRNGTASLLVEAIGRSSQAFSVVNHERTLAWSVKQFSFTGGPGSSTTLRFTTMNPGLTNFVALDDVRVTDCCLELICPPNIVVDCQSANGAPVDYSVTATNHCGAHEVEVFCVPASGSLFAPGTTTVNCIASSSNDTRRCSFTVTVRDNCASNCIDITCPENLRLPCESIDGTHVEYTIHATNRCNPADLTIMCVPPSGSLFQAGKTTVRCEAIGSGQTNSCTFTVEILQILPLHILPFGPDKFRLWWQRSCKDAILEQSPTLGGQPVWRRVPEPVESIGDEDFVIVPHNLGDPAAFFRLRAAD